MKASSDGSSASEPEEASGLAALLLPGARVYLERRLVERADGTRDRLTTLEAGVLRFLADNPERVISRDELLAAVWGYTAGVVTRACDTTIHRLRIKIEVDPADPEALITVHGSGYKLVTRAPTPPPALERSTGPAPSDRNRPPPPGGPPPDPGTPPHAGSTPTGPLALGDRVVDLGRARIDGPDGSVALTRNEIAVLEHLIAAQGGALDREVLQRRVWGAFAGRPLASTIVRLRRKLESAPDRPRFLLTTASGYRLELGEAPAAPPAEPRVPADLPAEVDARFGREDQIAELVDRLEGGSRIVTLTGLGGVGKTRLALGVARVVARSRRTFWFDLAEAHSVERMYAAMARTLRLQLGRDPLEQLGRAVHGLGPCLLVLDNLEQLLPEGAAAIAALATSAEAASFLVTSRVALSIRGERRFTVGPLDAHDAIALFVDRSPRALGPDELEEVGPLVDMLERLPLAIELAAARTGVLPVPQIRRTSASRLRLLSGADPSRPARHRSLRASLDLSWGLLGEPARRALAQLAVFGGGFGLEAAEQVLELPEGAWPVDALQELVDAGLLRAEPDRGRFAMPVVVQEYASEHLDPAQRERAEILHGRAYAALGEPAALARIEGHQEVERLRDLARDLANLLSAAERALDRGDGAVALATLEAAWEVVRMTGPYGVLAPLAERLLGIGGEDPGRALLLAASVRIHAGDLDRAERALLEAAGRATDEPVGSRVHALLSSLRLFRDQFAQAEADARTALALARACDDAVVESWALTNLGSACQLTLRYGEARAHLSEALAIAERIGAAGRAAEALRNLAQLPGDPDERTRFAERAAQLARDRGDLAQESDVRARLLVEDTNRYRTGAEPLLERYVQLHRELGDPLRVAVASLFLGVYRTAHLRLAGAEQALRQAMEIGASIHYSGLVQSPRWRLGVVALLRGRLDEAERLLEDGLAWARQDGIRTAELAVLVLQGQLAEERGDLERAGWVWEEVVPLGAEAAPHATAEAMGHLGRLRRARGRLAEGEALHHEALAMSTSYGYRHLVCRNLGELAVARVEAGAPGQAEPLLAEAAAHLAALGDPAWPRLELALARAEVELALGRSDAAEAALRIADRAADESVCEQVRRARLRDRLRSRPSS